MLTYTEGTALGVDESALGLFRWNREGSNWQPVPAVADSERDAVTGTVSQLGTYAVGYDAPPPRVEIRSPEDGGVVGTPLPRVVARAVDEGTDIASGSLEMRLNGELVAADVLTSTGQLVYLPEAPLPNGTYTVSVSAADPLGNTGTASATFLVEVHRVYLPMVLRGG